LIIASFNLENLNIKAKTKKLEILLSFLCLIFLATFSIFDQPILHLYLFKDVVFGLFHILFFVFYYCAHSRYRHC